MDSIKQNLIPTFSPNIVVHHFRCQQAGEMSRKLLAINPEVVGLSVRLSPTTCIVESIALATSKEVFLLKLDGDELRSSPDLVNILDGFTPPVVAFGIAEVALHIIRCSRKHVRGVDLSTLLSPSTNKPWQPFKFAQWLCSNVRKGEIDQLWEADAERGFREVCLRAWLSAIVAEHCIPDVRSALRVDTRFLRQPELEVLGKMVMQSTLLRSGRPKEVENEFSDVVDIGHGEVILHNSRYKNRVRPSSQTAIVMTNADGQEFNGRAHRAEGKATTIHLPHGGLSGTIKGVRIMGREELTAADRAQDEFILLVLSGERTLRDSPFIRLLWFPSPTNLPKTNDEVAISTHYVTNNLNGSQRRVIGVMLDEKMPLVIAHGPPGTGKTSTISAAVKIWENDNLPVWIVAQSNVAVKNIAESLLQRDVDFKLIVSKEFYVEWHEHIYEEIEQHLLRSDDFPSDIVAMERTIGGSPVLLCTLSMLSNPILHDRRLYELVPMERLIVDESSQIDVDEFMHLFEKFKKLKKVCFFGDPKQLPPYGRDTVKSLQSVFEIKHLRGQAHFLNTQYRLPVPLGEFISEEVYDGKLRSEHQIHDMYCVAFVDATKGQEEKCGTSWRNDNEIQTITHLVRHYYQHKDFCVITPYDAQRAALERTLKSENLPWERVFNVDSFQGNEADYVIISVVRTTGPGFLSSQNRVNVMLTRCKAGMVIVTNRVFLRTTGAQYTLLGRLAQHWAKRRGESNTWTDWRNVAEMKANMPGVFGPRCVIPPAAHTTVRAPTEAVTKPRAPMGLPRHPQPASQLQITGQTLRTLPPADDDFPFLGGNGTSKPVRTLPPAGDDFPTLGGNGTSKPVAHGRWRNPAGLSAVKCVTAASVTSGCTPSHSSSGYLNRFTDSLEESRRLRHDHFPALNDHQGVKKVQRRK